MSKKNKQPTPEVLEEYINLKGEYQEQYKRKKETQSEARQRRQAIRELKENREWN
jgi:hypothetical protein